MIKLFSGSANPKLSQEVASILNLPLSSSKITRFANSEVKVTIKEKVKESTCFVIQPTSNPTDTHLMELLFFADALKRNGAKKIIAVIPYFGYARQNREHLPGESVSVNVVIRILEYVGFDAIFAVTLHDEATEGVFSVPFKNIDGFLVLNKKISSYLSNHFKNETVIIVSPDQGGVERAQNFADSFFHQKNVEIAVVEKKRNLEKIHQSKALNLFGNVKNKIAIIVDDIITSGQTLVNAADLCLKKGAKKVIAAVVHPDLSPNAKETIEKSPIEKIFVTNTIQLKEKIEKIEVVSCASLIANTIKEYLS
jgi:ribose-phosphate pyrophosphokinase